MGFKIELKLIKKSPFVPSLAKSPENFRDLEKGA
jgi:hypothetical protein